MVFVAEKIDDAMAGWGAYLYNWKYKVVADVPQPHVKARTDPKEDVVEPVTQAQTTPGSGATEPGPTTPARSQVRPATPVPPADGSDIQQWSCSRCTFLNPYLTNTCDMCGATKSA